jgi:hypothetical protein
LSGRWPESRRHRDRFIGVRRDFDHHLYFDRDVERQLVGRHRCPRMLPGVAEYLNEKIRRAVHDERLSSEARRAVHPTRHLDDAADAIERPDFRA